jgi:hypothetical protein
MHKNLIKKDVNMKKFTKLSLIASSAILGTALLTGCGSNGTTSGSTGSDMTAVDGYVNDLKGNSVTAECTSGPVIVDSVGAAGSLAFATALTSDCNVTVPAGVQISAGESNETLPFAMKSYGNQDVASHLTTMAVELKATDPDQADALMALAGNFDPVKDLTAKTTGTNKEKFKKLLVLGDIIKTVAKAGGDVALLKDVNVSSFTDDSNASDLALSTIETDVANSITSQATALGITLDVNATDIANAANNKAQIAKSFVAVIEELTKNAGLASIDLGDLFVAMSDGGLNLKDAIKQTADINDSVYNSSVVANFSADMNNTITAIENNASAVANFENSLPPKLLLGNTLTLGEETITTNAAGEFSKAVSATNIADYFNITLPGVTMTKGFTAFDANLSVEISNSNSQSVKLSILNANIAPDDKNESVEITLNTNTQVKAEQTGHAALKAIIGTSSTASVTETMVNKDLAFNLNTLLDSLSTQDVSAAISELNNSLSAMGTYDVNITLAYGDANISVPYSSITGKVNVNLTDAAKVAAAKAAISVASSTTTDLTLPTSSNGATISWATSNADVLSAAGVVGTVTADTDVTLTATITSGSESDTKAFTVTVQNDPFSGLTTIVGTETHEQDGGVTLTKTSLDGVKIGFTEIDTSNDLSSVVMYISIDSKVAKIEGGISYDGKALVIEYDGTVYKTTFQSADYDNAIVLTN